MRYLEFTRLDVDVEMAAAMHWHEIFAEADTINSGKNFSQPSHKTSGPEYSRCVVGFHIHFTNDVADCEVEFTPSKTTALFRERRFITSDDVKGTTHLMPKQLLGPFEKATKYLSRP